MTKALFKYLLSLGILLLAGFGQLYAHGQQGSAFHASTKRLFKSEQTSLGTAHVNHTLFLKSALGGAENQNNKNATAESEIEETESTNSKKYL